MNHYSSQHKGFTLVETLVAISLLMLAILGPLSISSAGLRNSAYARDQITAYYLAQEGIEYVRYVRDDNFIKKYAGGGNGWLDGLDNCIVDGAGDYGCVLDSPAWFAGYSNFLYACITQLCDNDQDPKMYVTSDGYYAYGYLSPDSVLSQYKRVITVVPVTNDEVKIVSTMTWKAGGGLEKTFVLTENLFNLYKNR